MWYTSLTNPLVICNHFKVSGPQQQDSLDLDTQKGLKRVQEIKTNMQWQSFYRLAPVLLTVLGMAVNNGGMVPALLEQERSNKQGGNELNYILWWVLEINKMLTEKLGVQLS